MNDDEDMAYQQSLDEYIDKAARTSRRSKASSMITDHYNSFIMNQPNAGNPWSAGSTSKTDRYVQTVIDYDHRNMTVKIGEERVQAMLDDMREKIVQQILDEVSLLIDEAHRD